MDTLLSMRVFCLVAELKSFSAAADRLGLSPAMASKHVMHLERRLSARLLNRTSRHVSLNEAGALYFEQVRQMLESLEEADASVAKTVVIPHGTLKLSAPVWMANAVFAKVLADYQTHYPQVRFDIDLSGRLVNLVDEGFDLALRATQDPAEGLIARRLADIPFYLVASPAYLRRAGRPSSASELNGHALLAYTVLPLGAELAYPGPRGAEKVRFVPVLQSSNETLLHMAAVQGMGLALLPKWLIEPDLSSGRLEFVLSDKAAFQVPLNAVYPSRKYLSAKVRTFLDFIVGGRQLTAV
jgi:DNA-binding transcriptional LysR family regulator